MMWPFHTVQALKSQLWPQKCQLWTSKGCFLPYSPPLNQSSALFCFEKVLLHFSIWLQLFLPLTVLSTNFSLPSSVPCTSSEVFRASFWTTCWPTPRRPARLFPTRLCAPLLGWDFAAFGSTADVFPGSRRHRSRFFLLLFAPGDLVREPGLLDGIQQLICICYFLSFLKSFFCCHVNIEDNRTHQLHPKGQFCSWEW